MSDRQFAKNNSANCFKVELTKDGVEALRDKYHEVLGQPGFIDAILLLNPASADVRLFEKHPNFIQWSEDGDILLKPNLGIVDPARLSASPRHLKDAPAGLALTAWYIHPSQLAETVFSESGNRNNFLNAAGSLSYAPNLEPKTEIERSARQKKIRDTETQSGIPYLASIFDLTPDCLPWLRTLKSMTLNHLKTQYGVGAEDHVVLYFHGIIDADSTTLHLHARVNEAMHPLERIKSFSLDEVIDTLEKGIPIHELLLNRGTVFTDATDSKMEILSNIPNATVTVVPNPFIIPSQHVETTISKPGSWGPVK